MIPDLSTTYLGLRLEHPVVASAGPLTGRIETLRVLQEEGAAAVVLPSLFEEDAERELSFAFAASGFLDLVHAEAVSHSPPPMSALDVAQRHVRLVTDAKSQLRIPVIASLNGTTPSGWTRHAEQLVDGGADALELNVYRVVADPHLGAAEVEDQILALVDDVRSRVRVPMAVKIGPYFTALGSFVRRLVSAGADGVVMFNRFYQPDIDLRELEVFPSLALSTSVDLRLPLRWTALLSGQIGGADIALSGGVHEPGDVVKSLLAGATVVMTTSSLLRSGPENMRMLRDGLVGWMTHHEYHSVTQLRGSMAVRNVPDPDAYERANYVRVIQEVSRAHGMRIDG